MVSYFSAATVDLPTMMPFAAEYTDSRGGYALVTQWWESNTGGSRGGYALLLA